MFKITGLDKLTNTLEEAQKALQALDGELGTISFNPNDPASIEAAIQEADHLIDDRLGGYASNTIIQPLVAKTKERFREVIIEKAAAARLEGNAE